MDIYKTELVYERWKEDIKNWKTGEQNKHKAIEFLKTMEIQGISNVQLVKYIFALKQFVKGFSKEFEACGEQDILDYLYVLKDNKVKTKKIRFYCLKKFFDFIGKEQLFLKLNSKIKFTTEKRVLPDILTRKDVEKMIDAAKGLRNKTFIAMLYESGCRISELLTLIVKDVIFDDNGAILKVRGKTGERRIRILAYSGLLCDLIKEKKDDEKVFDINYDNGKKILKETAIKAGITKRIYPHLFRHSRASELANHFTESQLSQYFGWSQGSSMPRIYVHLCGKDLDETLFEIYGIASKNDIPKMIDKDLVQSLMKTILDLTSEQGRLKTKIEELEDKMKPGLVTD